MRCYSYLDRILFFLLFASLLFAILGLFIFSSSFRLILSWHRISIALSSTLYRLLVVVSEYISIRKFYSFFLISIVFQPS